jgi:hypothetical protein
MTPMTAGEIRTVISESALQGRPALAKLWPMGKSRGIAGTLGKTPWS